jgi:ATP-dependent RNA helicase DDX47/RRP3
MAAALSEADAEKSKEAFRDLGVCDELCEACADMGWKVPTEIQREALPPLLDGARGPVSLQTAPTHISEL